jgi:ABC-type sugar transport system ATPase subunit
MAELAEPPVVSVSNLAKSFGPTRAIVDATLQVLPGEVHAIVGENGSGKSTLVKILSGVHQPGAGSLEVAGSPVRFFPTPRAAQAAGIATVFQEVLTVDTRSVLDNIWIGLESVSNRVRAAEKRRRASAVLAELLEHPPALDDEVGDLSLSERQACSIARSLIREPKLLILDEATSALDFSTRSRLFGMVRRRAAEGASTILITHRMDEIDEIGDRITVMRSGSTVGTLARGEWSPAILVQMMTGAAEQAAREGREPVASADSPVVLEARELALRPGARPFGLSLRAGEVVGVAGLEGHGQDVFLKALAGLEPVEGEVERVDGSARQPVRSHRGASRLGIAYVPRERRAESIFQWMSIVENFAIATSEKDRRGPFLSERRSSTRFAEYLDLLKIKIGRGGDAITTLSGGNQQKVTIARWLASHPRILILNDPTRGIDVNAKRDLYTLLDVLAKEGLAVVMLSTEVDEHLELMDRVLVFREGELAAELSRAELTRGRLVASFFGGQEAGSDPTGTAATGTASTGTASTGTERQAS